MEKVFWLTNNYKKKKNKGENNVVLESTVNASNFLNKHFTNNTNNREEILIGNQNTNYTANVSTVEVKEILKNKKGSAQGIDKITFGLIQKLNENWMNKLCELINNNINAGNINDKILVTICPIAKKNQQQHN